MPPERAEQLHELQFGWTHPIRDYVRQMFEYFDKILNLKSLKTQEVAFNLKMMEPANIDAFNAELKRLEKHGPTT